MPISACTPASVKSRLVLPFWYRLTDIVSEKGPLNGCVCTASSNAVSMSNLAWQQSWRRCPVRTRGKGRRLACSSWTPRWEHADVAGRLRSCTARPPARMLPLTPTTCRRALSQCPVPCRWLAPPAQRPSYLTCRNCRRSQLHGYLQGKRSRSQWSRG